MNGFKNILALDTALGGCNAAVVAGEREAVRCEAMVRGQAEHLVPFAQEVMAEAGLSYAALDAVLCTVGPGAFTGLRIAMSAAQVFGLSLDIPVIGVTTLQALALNYVAEHGKACSVILETKRSDFYVQDFDAAGQAISEARAMVGSDLVKALHEDSVFIGDGAQRFLFENNVLRRDVNEGFDLIDLAMVARTLCDHGLEGQIFKCDPQPVYLRDADVSQPKKEARRLRGS
ncbi:MAG: tRNA (adenosine(37)-N6)-threonylcarbamoyltransferase complex dimerization subunit type 1 TsaB [Rhodospirillales bacterium]|nr:tRNA (adenosine(37)-N6)-threonylcarbamoyltransferase complex dimerization subunit type 1 TsaB [Rhodospirillales bacterium]